MSRDPNRKGKRWWPAEYDTWVVIVAAFGLAAACLVGMWLTDPPF